MEDMASCLPLAVGTWCLMLVRMRVREARSLVRFPAMLALSAVSAACVAMGGWPAGATAEQASQPTSIDARQIDTGASHSCALLVGGKVRCWGFNGTVSSATPTRRRWAMTRRRAQPRRSTWGRASRPRRSAPAIITPAHCSTTGTFGAEGLAPRGASATATPTRSVITRLPALWGPYASAPGAAPWRSAPAVRTRVRCSTTAACVAGGSAVMASSVTATISPAARATTWATTRRPTRCRR